MITISDVVSLKERGKYQSILGAVVVLSNSLGPLIGGALSEQLSWRWCFVSALDITAPDTQYIDIPLSVGSILIVFFLLPIKRVIGSMREKLLKIDYLGAVLMTTSAILIMIPLSWFVNPYSRPDRQGRN